MNENLAKNYIVTNDVFGIPQEYKKLKIHPIKTKDSKEREFFYKYIAYPKNFLKEKDILKMSFLRFLILVLGNDHREETIEGIKSFIRYITKIDDVYIDIDKVKELLTDINKAEPLQIKIGDVFVNEWEFEELREIILEQNGLSIEFVNQFNPELEQKLSVIFQENDIDFTDQVFTLCILMKKTVEEIGEFTLYQFRDINERIFILKQFDLYQPLAASGQITMKNGNTIRPFLYHRTKKGRYDDILISTSKFLEKNAGILK